MKGFELSCKGIDRKMAVKDGIVSILVFNSNGNWRLMANGVDHHHNKKIEWYNEVLKFGDKIQVKFTEIDNYSDPIQISNIKSRNEQRLEKYNRLKESLTKKGVL